MRNVLLRRTLTGSALTLSALAAAPAAAQIAYSGVLNRALPGSAGPGYTTSYLQNVVTRSFYTASSTPTSGAPLYPTCPNAGCDWDFGILVVSDAPFGWRFVSPAVALGNSSPELTGTQVGYVGNAGTASAVQLGTVIGASSSFIATTPGAVADAGGYIYGDVIGFRFRNEAAGTTHFGWVRLLLPKSGPAAVVDYAYNTVPGASIEAGFTGVGSVIPEPSSSALLAAGLAGVGAVARRRRRGARA